MEYYVTGNLKHDGKEYERGQSVDLSDETAASQLLEAGVIQTEPISEDKAEDVTPEPERQAEPEVAGKAMETGEPSIDGEPERGEDKAEDITPTEADAEAQEGQEAAGKAEEAKEEPQAEEAPKTASQRRRMRALSPDTKEENDPSAGL